MIEESWLTCEDPKELAGYLFGLASPRKLRLWACACGHEVIRLFENPRIGNVLSLFEDVADGVRLFEDQYRSISELQWACEEEQAPQFSRAVAGIAHSQWIEMAKGDEAHFALGLLHLAWAQAYSDCPTARAEGPTDPPVDPRWRAVHSAARQKQLALARDIFGNPFRPVHLDSIWRTSAVVSVARDIYKQRSFAQLPRLADVLEDAGCADEQLLGHCRAAGQHVRGCWAIDLLLEH